MTQGPLRVPVSHLEVGEQDLDAAASRYVCRVHRLGAGAPVVLFDPVAQTESDAVLVAAPRRGLARVLVLRVRQVDRATSAPLTLLVGRTRGTKVDEVVRRATELGATAVVVVATERSEATARPERLERVAVEAARQCGRGDVPELYVVADLALALSTHRAPEGASLLLHPRGELNLAGAIPAPDRAITVAVGPEGGWTDAEIATAERTGYCSVRLGRLVLRAETACIAALSVVTALRDRVEHEAPQ